MTDVVADIGGTNLRVGLVENAQILRTEVVRGPLPQSEFVPLVRRLLGAGAGDPGRIVVSVAGPVIDGVGYLTNRDWALPAGQLGSDLNCEARIINDMAATGFSLPHLTGDQVATVRPGRAGWGGNAQALVVNAGTGFNVCPVRHLDRHTITLESETGHALLPAMVADRLRQALGTTADNFPSIELLLAGPALPRLTAAATAAGHAEPMAIAAELFGMTCGDLALRHWPDQGLWLAGSAARAMAREGAAFLSGLEAAFAAKGMPPAVIDHLRDMPVVEIADDLAPLRGCVAQLREI